MLYRTTDRTKKLRPQEGKRKGRERKRKRTDTRRRLLTLQRKTDRGRELKLAVDY